MSAQFLPAELAEAKDVVPTIEGCTLIACVPAQVRVSYWKTDQKQLNIILQFPANYPDGAIVTELTSKTLSEKLLAGLIKMCDEEAKKKLGQKQVLHIVNFVRNFVIDNPLCVCSEEIASMKKDLLEDCDRLKLKQDTSQILLKIVQERYVMNLTVTVPNLYPTEQVKIEAAESNFPDLLKKFFVGQAVEIARKCVQPPIKPKKGDPTFKPDRSLKPVCEFLVKDCVRRYPQENCPICKERALLKDPEEVIRDPKKRLERVYCGHLYHHICLGKYLKTPPFAGGKHCSDCGKQIFHDKWRVTPEVMEARWAAKQAKQRELDEVADFMS